MVGLIWFLATQSNPSSGLNSGSKTWVWVEENFVIEIGGEGGGDFLEVGFLTELRDMNEKDFGFERFFVSIFHGLEIDVITEIAYRRFWR